MVATLAAARGVGPAGARGLGAITHTDSLGTTLMALLLDGGVALGADLRAAIWFLHGPVE